MIENMSGPMITESSPMITESIRMHVFSQVQFFFNCFLKTWEGERGCRGEYEFFTACYFITF